MQACLGDLETREAFRNPFTSSCSLQLLPEDGGDGPHWGFEGFPKRTYLIARSGEISNDQHLSLAHRMASGTCKRVSVYAGDQLSKGGDLYETAAQLAYPRPSDHQIALWPSANCAPIDLSVAPGQRLQDAVDQDVEGYGDAAVDNENDNKVPFRRGSRQTTDVAQRHRKVEAERLRSRDREIAPVL